MLHGLLVLPLEGSLRRRKNPQKRSTVLVFLLLNRLVLRKSELAIKLLSLAASGHLYCLDGGLPRQALCLNKTEGGKWEVYYSERGRKTGLVTFANEEEAADFFYSFFIEVILPDDPCV
jgi:hypothetical protein